MKQKGNEMNELAENSKYILAGGFIALFIALAFIFIGFFKTILLFIFVIGDCVAGGYVKKYSLLDYFK